MQPYRSSPFSFTGISSDSISNLSKHWSHPCCAHLFQTELLRTRTLQLHYLQHSLLYLKISQTQSYWFDISLQLLFQEHFSDLASNPFKNCSEQLGFRLLFLKFSILIQTTYFWHWFWMTLQRFSPKKWHLISSQTSSFASEYFSCMVDLQCLILFRLKFEHYGCAATLWNIQVCYYFLPTLNTSNVSRSFSKLFNHGSFAKYIFCTSFFMLTNCWLAW